MMGSDSLIVRETERRTDWVREMAASRPREILSLIQRLRLSLSSKETLKPTEQETLTIQRSLGDSSMEMPRHCAISSPSLRSILMPTLRPRDSAIPIPISKDSAMTIGFWIATLTLWLFVFPSKRTSGFDSPSALGWWWWWWRLWTRCCETTTSWMSWRLFWKRLDRKSEISRQSESLKPIWRETVDL